MSKGPNSTYPNRAVTLVHADDHEPWHRVVRDILLVCPQWNVVATACDGEEAVQKAIELQPDVVILDVGMPKLNGLEAAHRIREKCLRSQIVFLTQDGDPHIAEAALAIPAARYVLKANAATELVPTIAAVLGR